VSAIANLAERLERGIRPGATVSAFAFVAGLLTRGFSAFFLVVLVFIVGTSR